MKRAACDVGFALVHLPQSTRMKRLALRVPEKHTSAGVSGDGGGGVVTDTIFYGGRETEYFVALKVARQRTIYLVLRIRWKEVECTGRRKNVSAKTLQNNIKKIISYITETTSALRTKDK